MSAHRFGSTLAFCAKILFGAGVLMLAVVWLFEDEFPEPGEILPQLLQQPVQQPTSAPLFTTRWEGAEYRVQPLYSYELWGMVVSLHHSDVWWDYTHREANDFLNVLDFCVIWGERNTKAGIYRKMSFYNAQFTCYFKANDMETYRSFSESELSNNHIMVADEYIRKRMKKIRVGDQIHFRGYLVEYWNDRGAHRMSSTTRSDTGPGACETVFVESFDVMRPGNSRRWQTIWWLGVFSVLASLVICLALACLPDDFHFNNG